VNFVTNVNYQELVIKQGLNFISLDSDVEYDMNDDDDDAYPLNQGQNPFEISRNLRHALQPIEDSILPIIDRVCQDAEVILFSTSAYPACELVEKLEVPAFIVPVMPMHPTRAFPSHMTPSNIKLGGIYNRLTYSFTYQLIWQFIRQPINQWRREMLGLPFTPLFSHPLSRMNKQKIPFLYGFSPSLLPKPIDWPDWTHVTGSWVLDSQKDWQAPKALKVFIEAGSPPVFIGFGNKGNWQPEDLTQIVLQGLKISGKRGVLLVGDDLIEQDDFPDEVFPVKWVPFDWLFPQMAAVIHHAGCGTVHAALQAGVPNIIVPFHSENFLWAHRVAELGLGIPPIRRKELSAERLAEAIQTVTSDREMQARALKMSQRIQAEDGVARAVEIIHQYVSTSLKGTQKAVC